MNYYLDIRVLPTIEFKETTLLSEIYNRLHLCLAKLKVVDIGVSFPDAKKTLGRRLRIHGAKDSLEKLMSMNWHISLKGYIVASNVMEVPLDTKYRTINRIQVKSNILRLLRRSVKKGWLTEDEAAIRAQKASNKSLNLPYIEMNSSSTEQRFKLFIEQGSIKDVAQSGLFTSYGLSGSATVPWF